MNLVDNDVQDICLEWHRCARKDYHRALVMLEQKETGSARADAVNGRHLRRMYGRVQTYRQRIEETWESQGCRDTMVRSLLELCTGYEAGLRDVCMGLR